LITTVEERLVSLGIVTEAQARSGDIDPSEAENLEALQQRVDDTVDAGDSGAELITTVEERLVSLGIVTEAQARSGDIDSSEAENLEALQQRVDDTVDAGDSGAELITTVEERLVSLGIVTEVQARSGDIDPSEAENLEALQQRVDDTVDAGDSGAELITTVEERLVSLGIVTEAQARSGDISPSEAENLEALQQRVDDTVDAGDSGADAITTVEERLVSLGIVTEAQARSGDIDSSEAENLEALQKTVDDTAEVVIDGADVITTVEERLVSLGIVTEAQARSGDIDSAEAENLEALQQTGR